MAIIDSTVVRPSAVSTLIAANTSAGKSVYSPKDWPNNPEDYPCIIARTPHERKENVSGRNGVPAFFTTIMLTAVGRVKGYNESDAEAQLETLSAQIEAALLTNQQFIRTNGIQQFVSVETSREVRSESGVHYGETATVFSLEVYQEYDSTIDAAGNPMAPALSQVTVTIDNGPGGEELASASYPLPTGA